MYPNIFITSPILNKINVLGLILKVKRMVINLSTHNFKILAEIPVQSRIKVTWSWSWTKLDL